ncbi:MAG TPA: DEAD/DEAH box helicase [Allosphingosinicella sp.]|nr:DEAD/DEAH box helicase [Allosphingosinicella sp.]
MSWAPDGGLAALSRLLQAWADNETDKEGELAVRVIDGTAILSPALVASLGEAEARALGLPPATRLTLQLASRGGMQDPDFQVAHRWTRSGGVAAHARINGARIAAEGKDWRLVEPLYSAVKAVAAVNAAPTDHERQQEMAALKLALGEEASARIDADGYIEQLRLSYAAAFSLDLKVSPEGFDFDPVLFSRERAAAAADEEAVDEVADNLLSPVQQRSFAARFRATPAARSAYLLNDGGFLFIDPALKGALGVVHAKQSAAIEERREFVRNPRRVIREALLEHGEGQDGLGADDLFVETQQFSERVSGIDVWRKPVMPWIKPRPNSWLPELFGIRVGEGDDARFVEIAPAEAEAALATVETAIGEGSESVEIAGVEIPATEQSRSALSALAEIVREMSKPDLDEKAVPAELQRYFLQVRDNLDEIAYAPLGADRPAEARRPVPFPSLVSSIPKEHQKLGFDWLVASWQSGGPGVLLADDMGLGKTFQALAFLAWVRKEACPDRPVLIVAPTGLLANWRAEIETHLAPGALGPIVKAYGSDLSTFRVAGGRDIDAGSARLDTAEWMHAGVVMTTYETLRDYHMSFARLPFGVIVYDEIQKLKNPASQMTRAAKTMNGRFQIAMTGTPVENRLQDLWSILDLVRPGLLGSSKAFEENYPATDRTALAALHDLLTSEQDSRPPILLRRMKEEVVDGLPAKHIRVLPCDMPPSQARAYEAVLHRAMAVKSARERGRMLEILQLLRGVSLHPRSPETAAEDEVAYGEDSARLKMMFSILDDVARKGEKALIFCESLTMQAYVAAAIRRRYRVAHEIARIHGGVAGEARQRAVDTFQVRGPGFDAMVLSPKAGGVGLTLTKANHVIHLSRWWNPAVEDQATDRAYRIGQSRDVYVYVPQAVHPDPAVRPTSFDLKLDALMRSKRELSRHLLVPLESDSDASALFDAVTSDELATAPAPPAPAHEPVQSRPESEVDPDATEESAESSTAAGAAQIETAGAAPKSDELRAPPRRVVFRPGMRRDFSIFEGHLTGERVVELRVRDPYACASPSNRGHLLDFLKIIQGASTGISLVSVTCWDAETARPDGRETNADQRRDFEGRWAQRFGAGSRPKLNQISGRQVREFHDRYVEAITSSGKKLIWDLGRGVDGVMNQQRECVVTCTIDPVLAA